MLDTERDDALARETSLGRGATGRPFYKNNLPGSPFGVATASHSTESEKCGAKESEGSRFGSRRRSE
jgi:hypothetical protein